ncbi:hypothetical protein FS837_000351 [Tulasnella sp. UAMH 9824]|nr:hypothetical protein FS837_000351 [Tulasnella sp. UAMH 9824]
MLILPGSSLATVAGRARLATVISLCRSYYSQAIPLQAEALSKGAQSPLAYPTPDSRYHELVDSGLLRKDDHQDQIVNKLQGLHERIARYSPPPIPPPTSLKPKSLFSRLFATSSPPTPSRSQLKGLYLYGTVGTGKTMLMDLFYDTLPPSAAALGKRRVHFHAFMIDVHKRVHQKRVEHGWEGVEDVIAPVARDLAEEARILCFDEFQVTDIVDAMILRRLLECLLQYGVVSVMTSNRHPDELYKNGIQRASFLPAIDLIKERFDVTDLNSHIDYRKIPHALAKVYFDPIDYENKQALEEIWDTLTSHTKILRNDTINVWGHKLRIPESTSTGIARFTFDDLCGRPLGAADYIEITQKYNTLFVTDVPKLTLNSKDKARRFITLIDACYENHTRLFVLSEVPIHLIFSDDPASLKDKHITDHMRSTMDDLGLTDDVVGSSSIFSGDEEIFAFARACSRLIQMGTKEWVEAVVRG